MENKNGATQVAPRTGEKGGAYLISHVAIKDAAKWAEYREKVPATIKEWGGQHVFGGRRLAVLSGEHPYTEVVVIRFPDAAAIEGWYKSAAYQALIPLRDQAGERALISFET
jgi:uncharacterized protein (DUF1330 family)